MRLSKTLHLGLSQNPKTLLRTMPGIRSDANFNASDASISNGIGGNNNNNKTTKNPKPPASEYLQIKQRSTLSYVDTHCHISSTLESYRKATKDDTFHDESAFVRHFIPPETEAIVDIFCDAPVDQAWKRLRGLDYGTNRKYYFAVGVHPHNTKDYNDSVEKDLLEAHQDPKCIAWGEMGLDYHYDLSPRDIQQAKFVRQLELAVNLGKPLVIHTREADDDMYRLLTEHVPKEHRVHVHCFSDTPEFARKLVDHFPNLYIGITGVITYATNLNTTAVVKDVVPLSRLLLETDSPYMTPTNVTREIRKAHKKVSQLPVSHSGMISHIAQWIADLKGVTIEQVLETCRKNTKDMYGI